MRIVSVLFAAALVSTLSAQAPTLKPGQYELVSQFSMAGRSGGLPARKDLHCYTAQELQDLAASVAKINAEQNCKLLNSKTVGSTMTFATECVNPDGRRLTSSGEMTFMSPDSYHVVVTMKSEANPALDGTTMDLTAKRIGDCTK